MADNPDLALGVEFFVKAVEHPRKSKEAGRPVYEDREYIRIRFPADNKRELVAPAHEMHYVDRLRTSITYAERFADAYAAFRANNDAFLEGTPLSEFPYLTESRRAELKSSGVRTVEQLAGMPDSSIKRLGMGYREIIEKARTFLDTTKNNAATMALQDEVENLRRQIAELSGKASDPVSRVDDDAAFDGFDEDDLRNMLQDATGEAPDGRLGRKGLIRKLQELQSQKEQAA